MVSQKQIKVYAVVTMHNPVAHPDDLTPRDFQASFLPVLGDSVGCFADNLDQPHQREVEHAIRVNVGSAPAHSHFYRFRGVVEHVAKADFVLMPRHRGASLQKELVKKSIY